MMTVDWTLKQFDNNKFAKSSPPILQKPSAQRHLCGKYLRIGMFLLFAVYCNREGGNKHTQINCLLSVLTQEYKLFMSRRNVLYFALSYNKNC